MKKAPEAFRTISEVSDLLATPAHVLRFWESKFYQIRPVKRAGGRRYYRPDDVALINGIRLLLQDGGLTIRGVQRILQEKGLRHVIDMGSDLPGETAPTPPPVQVPVPANEGGLPPAVAPAPAPRLPKLPDTPLRPAWPLHLMPEPTEADLLDAEQTAMARGDDSAARAHITDHTPEEEQDESPVTSGTTEPQPASPRPPAGGPERAPRMAPPPPPPLDAEDETDLPTAPRLPQLVRGLRLDGTGPQRDRMIQIARRLDTLLERMSEASGAGRW
jgi:DNA-binding transcriptional MerR regulator